MSTRRMTESQRVVHFFETAKLEAALAIFEVVKDKMRARQPKQEKLPFRSKAKASETAE